MRRPRAIIGALLLGSIVLWLAYVARPAGRDSWRTFAREAKGDELRLLFNDMSHYESQRWGFFLEALRAGDEEAFTTAERLFPLIRDGAHPSEELLSAVSAQLHLRPRRVLEAARRGDMPVREICEWADRSAREPLLALLDGGLDDAVRECLVLPR
jgi:hypothetical protein